MTARDIKSRQYLSPELIVLSVDGSEVTTGATALRTGLVAGQFTGKIRRDATGDANLWIFEFDQAFGREPLVFFQPITLDCALREEANYPTFKELRFKSFLASNLATPLATCDFNIIIFGTKGTTEHGN